MSEDDINLSAKGMAETVNSTKGEEAQLEAVDPDQEPVPHLHAKTFSIVFAVMVVYVAQVINLTGCGAYGRAVAAEVGGAEDASWLISVTALLVAVFGPPVSQAADYWGRRWFLIIPTFCGVIGSIIMARATSMGMAIAGDTILSLSYAAQPLLHAVASEVLTHRNRAGAQAAVNIGSGTGGIIGLLAGAALTKSPGGFRNFWYMCAGVYALGTIVVFIFYTPPPRETQLNLTFREKINRLDWIGFALLVCGLVLFVMGLSWAENPYSWKDAHVLCPLLVGIFFTGVFVIYEWKFTTTGMVHHDLFSRDRNFALSLGCVFVEGMVFFAANAYLPYQSSVLYTTDPMMVALHFALVFIIFIFVCMAPAIYCYKTKRLRLPIMFAFLCFLGFNIGMATAGIGSAAAVWGYAVLLAFGLAFGLCALVTAAQLSAPPHLIAITSGLMVSMRSLGATVGLAIYAAVFNSKLSSVLGKNIAKAALSLGLPESSLPSLIGALTTQNTQALAKVPGVNPQIIQVSFQALQQSFVASFRGVWITAACFTVLALAASCFVYDPIEDFNMHIDAPAEREEDIYGEK